MPIKNFHLTESNLDNFIAKLREELKSGRNIVANVFERKSNRTIQQNSRLWKLYTELGIHIGETPDRVHELMGYKFLRELITVNGETFEHIKSTTKLDTKAMAEYQENIERWANMELGFYFGDFDD